MDIFALNAAKLLSSATKKLNLGNGSTWPGHLLLKQNPHFLRQVFQRNSLPVILIAGTNGKTTTATLLAHSLMAQGKTVLHNDSGANLISGIASTVLMALDISGTIKADVAIFEVDENALPRILSEITPAYLLLLNLFRDQLDRYGEVDMVARMWQHAVETLPKSVQLILNADDPQIAYLGTKTKAHVSYFGLSKQSNHNEADHAADSIYCPKCGHKLIYTSLSFSHLGAWHCPHCHLKRPLPALSQAPRANLFGMYNQYNLVAAAYTAQTLGVEMQVIEKSFDTFSPAFGRQEELLYHGRKIKMLLSKNPTGLNESLRAVSELGGKSVMLALNDRYADGTDISWIWDVDFERFLPKFTNIIVAGERAYEMALRVSYATDKKSEPNVFPKLFKALDIAVSGLETDETLFVLPTYTAMLEIRKIITGKKIL